MCVHGFPNSACCFYSMLFSVFLRKQYYSFQTWEVHFTLLNSSLNNISGTFFVNVPYIDSSPSYVKIILALVMTQNKENWTFLDQTSFRSMPYHLSQSGPSALILDAHNCWVNFINIHLVYFNPHSSAWPLSSWRIIVKKPTLENSAALWMPLVICITLKTWLGLP